jgi:hypothetical protein
VTPFPSHRRIPLLLLFLASGVARLWAGTPHQDLTHALSYQALTGWALADFNGDDSFDLATASSARHDSRGYSQEVSVSLGSYQQSSFKFRSPSATVDLSTPDLDGDLDRDLVVREPLSMTPIGVWLNDGAGSFYEGDLADFPELTTHHDSIRLRIERHRIVLLALSEERVPMAMPGTSGLLPRLLNSDSVTLTDSFHLDASHSDFSNRGPPRNAQS